MIQNSFLSLALSALTGMGVPAATPYSTIQTEIMTIAKDNPQTSKVINIGKSDAGEDILGLQLGDGPVKHLVVATHHGNEYGSTEVARALMKSLATTPLNGITVYVIPVLNTSGYNRGQREEINAAKKSIDPNRDYPGPCKPGGSYSLKSTKALADFISREGIVASATLHTYWPAVVYPWGIPTQDLSTPDDGKFMDLVKAATVESRYQIGNNTEILYPVNGAYEDYAYWKHGIWSLLFELGESHTPNQGDIAQMVAVNVPGIRRFLQDSPTTRSANNDFKGTCDRVMPMRTHLE